MKLSNYQLVAVGNFLQSIKLPAQVSRARTKVVMALNSAIKELAESERELVTTNGGTVKESGAVEWPEGSNPAGYNVDHGVLLREQVELDTKQPTLDKALKDFFATWNEQIEPQYAEAFDAFYDALDILDEEITED